MYVNGALWEVKIALSIYLPVKTSLLKNSKMAYVVCRKGSFSNSKVNNFPFKSTRS